MKYIALSEYQTNNKSILYNCWFDKHKGCLDIHLTPQLGGIKI